MSFTNRHAEAVAEARRARELSPMTPLMFALESQILLRAGHEEEAIIGEKGIGLRANFGCTSSSRWAYSHQKRYVEVPGI